MPTIKSQKTSKKEKLNLTQNLSVMEYTFRPSAYSKIIGPGSQKPFEFDMLSEVEDCLQFNVKTHPGNFKSLFSEVEQKLSITFWGLLKGVSIVWLFEEINLLFFMFCQIAISLLTKYFLDAMAKQKPSSSSLTLLVLGIVFSGIGMSIFHMNYLLYNCFLMNINENWVKVICNRFFNQINLIQNN